MIGKKINQLATELAPASTDLTIIGNPTTGVSKKITLAQLGAIFSGAVSFYTNLASFPATGTLDVIFCAKDTQKLYLWSGSAYVEVFPSQALLDTYQLRSEKGVSNGYASLDSTGKVPISQLPSSIMEYKGTWNAATNTPTLANGTGDTGDVYICNVAGTVDFGAGAITFAVGDYVIYSGTIWQRSSGAVGTVTSVAASITGNAIGITGSPVTTSGTLAFAFAGTGAQYIKGDGTLATFPSTIAQATNLITEVYNSTGATLTKGTIVYINGGQGNLPTVTKALATGDSTSAQTFGVVQADITNNNNGYVVVAGKLSDLDTQAYTEGTQLYLSSTTAGTWTSTKQYAPAHLVYVGIVVRSHPTQGIVEIKIQNGYELDEIHNVAAQTPTNNDGLFWESATSLWKNKSIATVLGYTPQPQLSGTGFVKISGTTISYDNSTYLTTSAASSTYLPLILNGSANTVDINGQQFTIQGSAGGFTSGRIIVDPVFSAIGYQVSGVFNGLKILTNGNADFTNSGVTRFFNQVRFDSTLTDGTYTYTLPGATGTIALVGGAGVGTVTSVGLSSATSGVTIGSTPVTTSGTITLAIATASGSQQGLLSSTDWTTFNNKQNALTNPVTGTGTTNYLPKFTGTSTIGNSLVYDNGTNVGIGTATPYSATNYKFLTIDGTNGSGFVTRVSSINSFLAYSNSGGTTLSEQRALPIVFETTGTSRMTLDASGNLGLGTSSPDNQISVRKEASSGIAIIDVRGGVSGAGVIQISGNGTTLGSTSFDLIQNSAGALIIQRDNNPISIYTNNTERVRLNASGNLSIGNTNDSFKLDVSGTGRFTGKLTGANASFSANVSGDIAFDITNTNTTNGYGLRVQGGVGSTSYALNVVNAANTVDLFKIMGSGAATFSSSVTAGSQISILGSDGGGKQLFFTGGTTKYNFMIAAQQNVNNGLEITPSSAAGGSTFSTPAVVITSGGNVGIGTTSPSEQLNLMGANAYTSKIRFSYGASATSYYANFGYNSDGNKVYLQIADGSSAANIMTWNYNGNVGIGTTSPSQKLEVAGIIRGEAVNVYGSTDPASTSPYLFSPSTGTLGIGANGSERMRITSGGSLIVGSSTIAYNSVRQQIWFTGSSTQYGLSIAATNTGNTNFIDFNIGSGSAGFAGSISWNGSTVAYNTSSDYRLKTDYKDFSGLDLVSKIKTYNYEWKSDKSRSYGVIAHELQSVINYAVTGVKDGEQMQGVDYSKIVPVLIKAIQEQQQQIEQLKNK